MQKRRRARIPLKPRVAYAIKNAREFLLKTGTKRLPVDPFSYFERFGWHILKWSELVSDKHPDPLFLKKNKADAKAKRIDYEDGTYKYLVVYDDTVATAGRIVFTIAHELGHIVIGHLTDFNETELFRGGISVEQYKVLEREADEFAAELLSPLFVLSALGVDSPTEIASTCTLSKRAAENRSNFIKSTDWSRAKNVPDLIDLFAEYITEFTMDLTAASAEQTSMDLEVIEEVSEDYMDGIPNDENGRLLHCPRCLFDKFNPEAKHCTRCGEYLFNHCMNIDGWTENCGAPATGSERFCQFCGSQTRLLQLGYISPWVHSDSH